LFHNGLELTGLGWSNFVVGIAHPSKTPLTKTAPASLLLVCSLLQLLPVHEDLFNQLKNRWGWKETWQQTRQVLHRWVQILSISYAIPQLLVLLDDAKVKTLASFIRLLIS